MIYWILAVKLACRLSKEMGYGQRPNEFEQMGLIELLRSARVISLGLTHFRVI